MIHNGLKKITAVLFLICGTWAFAKDALQPYNNGDYKEAIRICEEEIKADPNNMNAYCVLCWSLIENRQFAEAEKRATEALKSENFDYRISQVLGEAKYNLGKYQEALKYFQRYIVKAPDSHGRIGRTYYYMGRIYINLAKFHHADIALSTAVRKDPLKDLWWQHLGYSREQVGDWSNALAAYEQALLLNPSQSNAKDGKARCLKHLR